MAFLALKCPNCGAIISRNNLKCQYCGAELIIAQDGLTFIPRKQQNCPKCSTPQADGAWFCLNCGEILAKDIEHVKNLQKKIQFTQEDIRAKLAQFSDKIEPNEFFYHLLYHNGFFSNKYYAVSDKKLIKFDYNNYWQAPLSEIVGVGSPQHDGYNSTLTIQTFKETVKLDFGDSMDYDFYNALYRALDNYTLQKKDIYALIYSLRIP